MAGVVTRTLRRGGDLALPFTVAAMDGCALYMVAVLFRATFLPKAAQPAMPAPTWLALMEFAAWAISAYLLGRTTLSIGSVRVLVGAAGLVASVGVAYSILPYNGPLDGVHIAAWAGAATYALLLCMGLWFVGGYSATEGYDFNTSYNHFRLSLLVAGLGAILANLLIQTGVGSILNELGAVPVWFFVWALASLAFGNREVVREESGKAETGLWTVAAAVSLGIVLFVGLVSGALGGQGLIAFLGSLITDVIVVVGVVVYWCLYVVFWLASFLVANVKPISGPRNLPQPTPAPTPDDWLERTRRQMEQAGPAPISPDFVNIVLWVMLVLAALVVVWVLSRGLSRVRPDRTPDADEERESLGAWDHLLRQVRVLLARFVARFRRKAPDAEVAREDDLDALRGRAEWQGTLTIRQIYVRLQRLAATAGYPRAPQQTPVEYLETLSAAMPGLRGDLQAITAAYVVARYGPAPATEPAVLAANSAWSRAEAALNTRLEEARQRR